MPYIVVKDAAACSAQKPWAVYTETGHETGLPTGKPHGCFASKEAAREQQKALYANVPDAKEAPPAEPPGYRSDGATDTERCGNCRMGDKGVCWGYANYEINEQTGRCREWTPEKTEASRMAETVEYVAREGEVQVRKDYSQDAREKLAKEGKALPDGSYPIADREDLKNAIQAIGRASDPGAAKAHIKKRAKALGATDLLPEDWRSAEDDMENRVRKCPTCKGDGKVDGEPCEDCGGTGQIEGGPAQENAADDDLERRAKHATELEGMVEHRAISDFELRDASDGSVRFTGYACTTEEPYEIADFTETICKGAFKRTLGEEPDVRLVINHGMGGQLPIARTKSGTLTLREDARGLKVDADLNPEDPDVRAILPKLKRGDVDEMSFAFRATRQDWNEDYTKRDIREVALHRGDVSIVSAGANPNTTATVMRSQDGAYELRIDEERIGRPISTVRKAALESVLDKISRADEELDGAVPALAEAIGVPSPEEDEDEHKSLDVPSYVDQAKARRARILGSAA
jgi:HK97 family phage prohead protease